MSNLESKFYLIHETSMSNFLRILEEGTLKIGSNVSKRRRRLSGGKPMDYVYFSILSNFYEFPIPGASFCFSIDLLYKETFWIADGWYADNMKLHTQINPSEIDIVQVLETHTKGKYIDQLPAMMQFQIAIGRNLSINENLVAMIHPNTFEISKKSKNKIIKNLKKNYQNIRLLEKRVKTAEELSDMLN